MDKIYLTIIQYDSPADQTFLVMNNTKIFGYFEDEETGANAMLTVMDEAQKQTLLSKGYYIQVVEENPDLNNYAFFHNEAADMGRNLASLGKVYLITHNHTLVKFNEMDEASPSSDFEEIPLEDIRAEVAKNNNVDLTKLHITATTTPSVTEQPIDYSSYVLMGAIALGILILIVAGIVMVKKMKSGNNVPPSDPTPPPLS